MLKRTVQLFIKALIIGGLVNMGLRLVAGAPLSAAENTSPHRQYQSLNHVPANSVPYFPEQQGN